MEQFLLGICVIVYTLLCVMSGVLGAVLAAYFWQQGKTLLDRCFTCVGLICSALLTMLLCTLGWSSLMHVHGDITYAAWVMGYIPTLYCFAKPVSKTS